MFYVAPTISNSPTSFTCGVDLTATCKYLEAAITETSTWTPGTAATSGTAATPGTQAQWGCYGINVMTDTERTASLEIGQGQANTKMITVKNCKGTDDSLSAASIAKAYNGGGKTDWFLPSRKELDALCLAFFNGRTGVKNPIDKCMGSGNTNAVSGTTNELSWSFAAGNYWSSSENDASLAWFQNFRYGSQASYTKGSARYVRPVRAF